jgi:molecular chaperone DnaK
MGVEGYGLGVDVGSRTVTAAICRWTGTPPSFDHQVPSAGPAGHLPGADSDLVARALSRVGGPPMVTADGRSVPGAAVVADAVAEVCAVTAEREGREPAGVVVAVPPSWGDYRRGLLHDALGAVLGVPSAVVSAAEAVVGAHVADGRLAAPAVLAVYDLGASTLDTAVVEVDDRGTAATRSVPPAPLRWGSRDVDDALVDLVRAGLDPQSADLDAEVLLALRAECVAARETLACDMVARVELDLPGAGRACVRLTREDLEDLLAAPVALTVEVLRSTVVEAGLAPEELDAVVVAGGCGAAPFVIERLSAELGRPVVLDDAPSHTAARGAAHLALALVPAAGARLEDDPAEDDGVARADRPRRSRRRPSRSRPPTAPGGAADRPTAGLPRRGLQRGAVLLAVVGALLLVPAASFELDGRSGTGAGDRQAAQAAETVAGPSPAAADAAARKDAPSAGASAPDSEGASSTGSDAGSGAGAGGTATRPASTGVTEADKTAEPPSTSGTTPPPASASPTGSPTSNPTSSTPTDPAPTTEPTAPPTEEPTAPPPPATDPPAEPSTETTEPPPPTDPPPAGTESPPPAAGEDTTQQTPPSETTEQP